MREGNASIEGHDSGLKVCVIFFLKAFAFYNKQVWPESQIWQR